MMTSLLPELRTPRLTLRLPELSDFDRYAELMGDEDACRWIGGHQPRAGAWALQGFAMFSLVETASGRWVGQAGPWFPDGWPGPEVGYVLHRDAWGKGYATEAVGACVDYAFEALGWEMVHHCISPGNVASKKVAGRVGSRMLRPHRLPAPHDVEIELWGQSRADWLARRATPA